MTDIILHNTFEKDKIRKYVVMIKKLCYNFIGTLKERNHDKLLEKAVKSVKINKWYIDTFNLRTHEKVAKGRTTNIYTYQNARVANQ